MAQLTKMERMALLYRLGGRRGKNGPTYQIEWGRGDEIERMALLTRLSGQKRVEFSFWSDFWDRRGVNGPTDQTWEGGVGEGENGHTDESWGPREGKNSPSDHTWEEGGGKWPYWPDKGEGEGGADQTGEQERGEWPYLPDRWGVRGHMKKNEGPTDQMEWQNGFTYKNSKENRNTSMNVTTLHNLQFNNAKMCQVRFFPMLFTIELYKAEAALVVWTQSFPRDEEE